MTNDTLSQRRAESVVNYLIENGIDADRLVAKGYGEKDPRVLDKDMGSFKSGDQMTDAFISKLKTTALKEQAHQLNRRTEFRVLRKDYVKKEKGESQAPVENDNSQGAVEEKKDTDSGSKETGSKETDTKEGDKKAEAAAATGAAAAAASKAQGEIYVAEKGDTYGSVAKKYNLTLKDLKTLNGIKAEQIHEGMELKVQMDGDYSDFDAKFYTLEKGDDSWTKVAKKVNMKSADLKKLNKGVDEDSFRPGLKIRIAK
jgi:LysM repeat protein